MISCIVSRIRVRNCIKLTESIIAIRQASQFKKYNQPVTNVPSNELHEIRDNFFDVNKLKHSDVEFRELRVDLIQKFRHITDVNVDATILGCCNTSNHLHHARDYINYMKSEGIEINNATWGRLLRLYYFAYKNQTLTGNDKNDILEIYDLITTKNPILDPTTCEHLILGMATTEQWIKCIDLLDMIKMTCIPNINSYSAIIARSFQDKRHHQIGWKLLNEMIEHQKQPRCEVFLEYFENIRYDSDQFIEKLDLMLNYIGANEIFVSKQVIDKLQTVLTDLNKSNSIVSLTKFGKCPGCQTFMERISLTNKEFTALRSSFLDSVLVRNDTFLKSTPTEVDQFVKFVDKHAPFHCVVDGLNVAYSSGIHKNNFIYGKLVASVVRYFVEKNMRILVLGRQHMAKWPAQHMDYIKKNSKIFLTNNLSQDDPFLLYAALKSGPTTDFFSRDLMRSHSFLLGTELKQIFKKWQQEHQYSLVTAKQNGKIIVKEPVKYNIHAHKINENWHVPFKEIYSANPVEIFQNIPNSWLCFSCS